jgi:hypothetical protein
MVFRARVVLGAVWASVGPGRRSLGRSPLTSAGGAPGFAAERVILCVMRVGSHTARVCWALNAPDVRKNRDHHGRVSRAEGAGDGRGADG